MTLTIEPLLPEHWPVVREIYAEGVASGRATFETGVPDWQAWDAGHVPECRLVALEAGRILGWAALSRVSGRRCYAGVAEVSVYVAQQAQGRGVGKALLQRLIGAAESCGFWTLQATIFAINEPSLRLHAACGFRVVGRRERIAQRDGVWHDTVVLELRSATVGV
jgi:L-amino acid N-acyltransferase YncA